MSDNWYFVSFNFKTDEKFPLDARGFIQWFRRANATITLDNLRLFNLDSPSTFEAKKDTDG